MAETEILKKKKKKTYAIIAKEFENDEIGETIASEDSLVMGRTIEVNLAQLMNDPKMQNIKLKFKINEVKDNKCFAEINKYIMVPTYVRRVVKPGKEKIEDSFMVTTKDNTKVRIKPIMLTKATAQKSVLSNLRNTSKALLQDYCKKMITSNFCKIWFIITYRNT